MSADLPECRAFNALLDSNSNSETVKVVVTLVVCAIIRLPVLPSRIVIVIIGFGSWDWRFLTNWKYLGIARQGTRLGPSRRH